MPQRTVCLLSLLAVFGPAASVAQVPERGIGLPEAVQLAWSNAPDRESFAARRAEAAARGSAARSLFPNAPYATGTYVNDKAGSNNDYVTYQGQLTTPLWLPGEGTATERVAGADAATAAAAARAARLDLARSVLDAGAQSDLDAEASSLARRRLLEARGLAAAIGKQVATGEAPDTDLLAARADADGAAAALAGAEAQAAASRDAVSALLGTEARLDLAAPSAALPVSPDQHPKVLAALRAVDAAREALHLAHVADRDDPELSVLGIHEKQGVGSPYDTRFGLELRIPFASRARNLPRIAAAETALTQAAARLALARREVALEMRQSEAAVDGSRAAASAEARAASALDRRAAEVERAWRIGEMPLIELVRARQSAFAADVDRARARIALQAAVLRLGLAQGEIP